MNHYDAIIIGSGQAGNPLAKRLAKAGYKTAIIEKRLVGGTCVNDGCTPTKTMIASGRMAYQCSRSNQLGVTVDDYSINFKKIVARKNEIVSMFRSGSEEGLKKTDNLDLIYGEAIFSGHKTLDVQLNSGGQQQLSAEKIFIDTGTTPAIPPIPGLEESGYLTSTTLLDLNELPAHLLIIGGSYIALEFGQLYRRLGSNVTIVETNDSFLKKEDRDVAAELKKILEEDGIRILTGTVVKQMERLANGEISATIASRDNETNSTYSHVLVAAGRKPQTPALQLHTTGVDTDEKGYIRVNDKLETNIPGIYALGDVKGGPAFTHIAYNDYVIATQNLLNGQKLTVSGRPVPYCIFTDPQLARIGITEAEAKKQGLDVKIATLPMEKVARGIETGETRGMMKAIVDTKTKKILGAAILAAEGGEVMTALQLAMMGGLTYEQVRYGVFAHPTYAESLNNLFMTIMD